MATHGATAHVSNLPDIFAAQANKKSPGLTTLAWRRFRRDKLAMAGAGVLLVLSLTAIFATPLAENVIRFAPEKIDPLYKLKMPGWQKTPELPVHWLGTDELGRDNLVRIVFGAQVSLFISVLTVALTLTIGTISGALAGFFGGTVDTIITRLIDVLLAVPGFFLLVMVSVVFRPPWWALALVIASISWMGVARLVRGEFLALKARDFVLAARTVGAVDGRIIFRHILPNATSPIIVAATLQIGGVILLETALSFLGLGVQPPTPSWGNMLTNAKQFMDSEATAIFIFIPGFFIFITVLAVNLMGNGLRDALDPRLKQ
ncbi:MAG: ABC transporter permease [Chloroflexota bacterium]